MSAEVLREAADAIRADYSDRTEAKFENAVADWLDHVARRASTPDWTHALAVARAYLGGAA